MMMVMYLRQSNMRSVVVLDLAAALCTDLVLQTKHTVIEEVLKTSHVLVHVLVIMISFNEAKTDQFLSNVSLVTFTSKSR